MVETLKDIYESGMIGLVLDEAHDLPDEISSGDRFFVLKLGEITTLLGFQSFEEARIAGYLERQNDTLSNISVRDFAGNEISLLPDELYKYL